MTKKIKKNKKDFLYLALPESIIKFMSTHSFPGIKEKSILQAVNIIIDGFKHSFLGMRASALSFKFIMAAIPALIILFIVLSTLVPIDTNHLMFSMLSEFLPEEIFKTISKPIYEASNKSSSGILSIATITCLYFAINSMRASMEIFNNTYHIHEDRPLWKQFCVASLMVLIILLLQM